MNGNVKLFYEKNQFGDAIPSSEKEKEYFHKRIEQISKYEVTFFKQSALSRLAQRYISILAMCPANDFEYISYRETAKELLMDLGISPGVIATEIEDMDVFRIDDIKNQDEIQKQI